VTPASGTAERTLADGAAMGIPTAGAVMDKAGRENFAVASRILPSALRDDLLAVYGFARLVDDVGDEAPGDRASLLDWVEEEVNAVFAAAVGTGPSPGPSHPVMRRLVPVVSKHGIPAEPFRALVAANRQDQTVHAYATYVDLMAYCALSANPVGHLVLYVLDAATPDRMRLSDSICSGLQLVEHWQDVAEDFARGRVYLPQEDLERFGVGTADIRAGRTTPAFRRLLAFEVDRAGKLLDQGAGLATVLPLRAGLAVAGFVGGGRAALDAIRKGGYDVLGQTPRPSAARRSGAVLGSMATAVARRLTNRGQA
jgi:squalene synthase HpnC